MTTTYRLTIIFDVDDDVTADEVAEFCSAAHVHVAEAVVWEADGNERSIPTTVREMTLDAIHASTPFA